MILTLFNYICREQNPKSGCLPCHHIVFLKTHKTGSSTVTNILFRYGDKRILTFVLGHHHLGWPSRFLASRTLSLSRQPNILCSHTRFKKKPMNWLFPPESSKYVTILRNTVDHFESTFNYYQLGRTFGFGIDPVNSLENFLERPLSFFNIFNNGYNKNRISFIRNLMKFDLGL